jgi:hypothetical protein
MQPNIFLSTLFSNTLTPCSYPNLKQHPGLNILPQHHGVMYLEFAGLVSVAVTYALFGLLHSLIHPDVSFPARIKRCYITPKRQVQTCFCAHCNLHVKLIFAHLPTRNSEQSVDQSTKQVHRNAGPLVQTQTLGHAKPQAVTLHCYIAIKFSSLDMAYNTKFHTHIKQQAKLHFCVI